MRINSDRLLWAAGALAFLVGCSGTYKVGVEPAGSAGVSAGGSSMSTGGDTFASGAGTGTTVPGSGGAGTVPSTGDAGTPVVGPLLGYCGTAYAAHPAPEFASPPVVWERIQLFLAPSDSGTDPKLPAVTTRQWAGDLAMTVLDSLNNDAAPGMKRFVSSWLPGTPIAPTWAAFFSVKGATLTDLLTTNLVRNPGSGVLTDDATLNRGAMIEIPARGAFMRSQLLCTPVPPPPPAAATHAAIPPGETRRQALEAHRVSPSCSACHALMDPLGFGLEHFDEQGAYSDIDNGLPIDSTGSIELNAGTMSFDGANDLGKKLAAQCEVAQCLARQMLNDAQSSAALPAFPMISDGNPDQLESDQVQAIAAAFSASKGDLRTLIREIVQSDAFLKAR